MTWNNLIEKAVGVAIYSFHGAEIIPGKGINLDLGDTVFILHEHEDWFFGYSKSHKSSRGIFPSSHIRLKTPKRSSIGRNSAPDPILVKSEDPVVKECRTVLREWGEILRSLFVNGGKTTYEFDALGRAIRDIMDGRRQLITGTLTQDQIRELKLRLTAKIDWKNRSLGLDLVPRVGHDIANAEEMGIVELYQIHKRSAENAEAGRGTVKKKKITPTQKAVGHHLYCSFRGFTYQLNDDCEVYFSLFDSHRMKFISERFCVKFTYGMSNFIDKLQSQGTTVFEDLGVADLNPDLYLVAQVVRVGRMFYSESAKKSNQMYKRPFAAGVLNIGEIVCPQNNKGLESLEEDIKLPPLVSTSSLLIDNSEEREFSFKLYSADEKDFHQLHELLIKKQMSKLSVVSGSFTSVGLKMHTGDLATIRNENPIIFKNAVSTRKLGFPDIIYPGDVRNDIYVTLEQGEFEKGGKSTGKNIEVSVLVLDTSGSIVPHALYGAVSCCGNGTETDTYESLILYHHNSPRWGETLRISVPIEKFPSAHLRIEYSHCSTKDKNSKKLFGFSFMKLMDDEGTTLKDGPHELIVYKCEDRLKLKDSTSYLKLPHSSSASTPTPNTAIIGNQSFMRSPKEILTVSTLLVSTKLTQNLDLVALLKWKSAPDRIKETLENMTKVSGEEVVKFLQDVLDVLFAMFLNEEGESNEYSGDVFIVLVNIFVILEEGKFEHFKPVIEAYITDHFAAALVYRGLLSTVQHYADVVPLATKEFYPKIQNCFESLEFIFKFIVQSQILFARATKGEIRDSFTKNVRALFSSLNKMLDDGSSQAQVEYVPIQAALVYNLSKMYNELLRIMPQVELTLLICDLFSKIPLRDTAHPLSPAKLTALHDLVKSELFRDKECRTIILPEVCKQLRHHLSLRQELKLCTDILDDVLTFLHSRSKINESRVHDDIETVASSVLEMLVRSILVLKRTSSIVSNLVTCLLGLLQLMDQFHYNRLWDEYREQKPIRDILLRVFLVFRDLIKHDVFPVDWTVMKLVSDSLLLRSLHEFSQPLIQNFLNNYSFDEQLWNQYFNLAVTYLTQPALQLEKFRSGKREQILQRYGDMRVQMGFQILSMWSNLGENKISFIPSMVGPFLEVTLVPEKELRKATLNIFYDMLEAEHKYHGDFKQVESELIDKLDMLVSQNKGDDEYRQLFSSILLEQINENEPSWKSTGLSFVSSVTRLLDHLLDYRTVLQGDENRDKRMSTTVNLLDFYKKEINRQEMYLRYIYKLHDLHLSAENFTEAGFTLLLHADMLNWAGDKVGPELSYPAQSEMERKEDIYLKILKYFDQGKVWEKGIPLCKELANLYEFKFFNYTKLSHILKTEASFFENILTQLRPEPEYFRVGFFGRAFPLFVRNKEFIYRGLEYERLAPFIQRIVTEWPSAQILKNIPPDESILNSDAQFIQICNVKPVPDANNPILKAQVPEKIQAFYNVNNVDAFSYDRRLTKMVVEDPDSQNEFKNMWIERTSMRTANPLPGILRWFEVVEKRVETIPPVRFACERIEEVNRQVSRLVNDYTQDSTGKNVNPLSMKLQGILDATVMGGLANYRDAFFSNDFLQNNPDSVQYVNKLRCLILEQVNILDTGLLVHGKLAPAQVQPLHNRLLECFAQMKTNVETDFCRSPLNTKNALRRSDSEGVRDSLRKNLSNSIINTPLPPVPLELKRVTESPSNRSSNSSGYGHLVSALFEGPNSDEDEVYSKPSESCSTTSSAKLNISFISSHSLSNGNLGDLNTSNFGIPNPPPIPNRIRTRIQSAFSPPPKSSNEYIFMPPSRVRELGGGGGGGVDKHNGLFSSLPINAMSFGGGGGGGGIDESFETSFSSGGTNGNNGEEEFSGGDGGPPLPPRQSGERKWGENGESGAPALPKRQPRKISVTSRNSLDLSTPSSPTKIGPPVPPKPKASLSRTESEEIYLNRGEIGGGEPESPSYEESFEKGELTNEKLYEKLMGEEVGSGSYGPRDSGLGRESPNNNTHPVQRAQSTTKGSHREFYTLPFEKK